MQSLLNKKVSWKSKNKIEWLNKKKTGKIIINWGNTVRVCWDDNTCTETSITMLKII